MAAYDSIGIGYDGTRRADPRLAGRLLALLEAVSSGRLLDVACGTGNYTLAVAAGGAMVTGLDASETMLDAARAKPNATTVEWVHASADAMPFAEATFDGAFCTLAVHHFTSVGAVFAEVGRVLRPGGRFAIFTADPEQMRRYWLGRYWPTMMARAIDRMPSATTLTAALHAAGFGGVWAEPYSVTPDLEDLFIYAGKHRPSIYLDARVRAGMSGFAQLSDTRELHDGLTKLAADIESGAIMDIVQEATSELGDYLWIVADRKPGSA